MISDRAAKLFHFARHLRPSQVVARIRLAAKRKALVALGRIVPWALVHARGKASEVCAAPPLPMFPPRTSLVRSEGGVPVCDLPGGALTLATPLNWLPFGRAPEKLLWTFHLHYMEYLEAVGDETFEALVRDWIGGNPPWRPGYWLAGWSSYSVSLRVVVWMQQFAERRERLSEAFRALMLESLVAQVRHLSHNLEVDLGGNHLLKNIKALLWAGTFFTGPEAKAWRTIAEKLLGRELDHQILADGLHVERSPAYHAQVYADLLECRSLLQPGALLDRLGEVLPLADQALADLTHPDGHVSQFNDGGMNMAYLPEILHSALPASGRGRSGFALEEAGYFGIRDGGDYLVVDGGLIGPDDLPGHGHGDIFSFEWSLDGNRVVVDAGVFEYSPGPERSYARSTAAHNTVTVDDADQCEFWGAFRVGRRARVKIHERRIEPSRLVFHGSHDGYRRLRGSPVHHRRLEATPRRIAVEDRIEGGDGQPICARLLFHPDCLVEDRDDGLRIRRNGIELRLVSSGSVDIASQWWFPDIGVRIRAPQVVISYGRAPCGGHFLLEALSPPQAPRAGDQETCTS